MKNLSRKNAANELPVQAPSAGIPNRVATREEIENLAYTIYEARGREWGRDLDHWLEAERALCGAGSPETAGASAAS